MKKTLLLAISLIILTLIQSCSDNSSNPVDVTKDLTNEALLQEINFARTKPHDYAQILKDRLKYFDGNIYHDPSGRNILTMEGTVAYNEAITFLESASAVGALQLNDGLSKAAMDHVKDCGSKGIVSHTGSDGSSPWDRIDRYLKTSGSKGENISFGMYSARDVIVQLIVDDGVSDRGHRTIIFMPTLKFVGFASGYHSKFGTMTVQDFVQQID